MQKCDQEIDVTPLPFTKFSSKYISNEEIYLPADTPAGKINPKRLKVIHKKQHARQRERLLNQQIAELNYYRRDFTTNLKDDLFFTPSSETACEVISGPVFLTKNNTEIMELLAMIPDMANLTQQDLVMTEAMDELIHEENSLLTLQPHPLRPDGSSDDDMNTSEDEVSLNGADDKHDGNDDEAIQNRKEKYLVILKKKYKKGFSKLREIHALQYKKLQEIQKETLASIPDDKPLPPSTLSPPTIPELSSERKGSRPKGKGKETFARHVGGRANEQQREALSSAHHIAQHLLDALKQKADPNTTKTSGLEPKGLVNEKPSQNSNSHHIQPRSTIPELTTQPLNKAKSRLSANVISQSPPVATLKLPPTATSKPPTVASSGPPVVATGSSSNNSNNSRRGNQSRRDSNQPLFDSRPKKAKPRTLMDNNNGFITVKNKPDRVIINGQDYGTPKDFDDAINGISRGSNAIHRRHLSGENYLYYKSPKGQLIALGTPLSIPLTQEVNHRHADQNYHGNVVFGFSFADVHGNVLAVLAFKNTSVLSALVLSSWSIPCIMLLSTYFLNAKYSSVHILSACVCLIGLALLIWDDTVNDGDTTTTIAENHNWFGDVICLSSATLYAISNVTEEHLVKQYTSTEFLGKAGFWGSILCGLQAYYFEFDQLIQIQWSWPVLSLVSTYVLCLFCMYSLVPAVYRMASATFLSMSLITSNCYSLVVGLLFLEAHMPPFYPIAYALVIVSVTVYSLAPSPIPLQKEEDEENRPINNTSIHNNYS
ncbi:hypothetical protein [Parasitella parasitica]|uniref:EamA domain-containing protein n=1 Tax=Parasitella parasitica TaxID=35722 RepID=A0A0B7NK33_9FUNG|nr:hypothetical protein [Parasitella parasitica]